MRYVYYRYEYESGCSRPHTGILVGLDDIFDEDEAFRLSWYFDRYLERPFDILHGTISYFTEKGNRKFNKAIREIKKAALNKSINVIRLESDGSNLEIVYRDEYQIVAIVVKEKTNMKFCITDSDL